MEETKNDFLLHLVAVPFPGRGHINPMLSLCHHLSSQNLLITVVVTEEWLNLLSSYVFPSNIKLRSIPNVVPSETTRGSNYQEFITAVLSKMGPAVDELVQVLDVAVDAMVADALLPWAPEIGERIGVPVAALFTQSATMFLDLLKFSWLQDITATTIGEETKQLKYLPKSSSTHLPVFTDQVNTFKLFNKTVSWSTTTTKCHSLLFSSSTALEPLSVHALRSALSVPLLPIGPTASLLPSDAPASCAWLHAQPPSSVLYVSLGSFLSISPSQMADVVAGLRMSGVRFLLVARDDSINIQELSGELGLVVPWADQVKILSHPSIGGFLTHCGWNSTMEGVVAGVPMLVFPLMWDQFPNGKLVVDEWRIGRRLRKEEGDGFVGREEVAEVVKEFMDLDSEEGKEMRRRVRELKKRCRLALEENGSSWDCVRAFVKGMVSKRRIGA